MSDFGNKTVPAIFTTPRCGWAIRNFAALVEKGQSFDLVSSRDADGNKTDAFLTATPLAQTPTMVADGISIWDSLLINEFIDERFPGEPLMPSGPVLRAEARRWMHYWDRHIIPLINAAFSGNKPVELALEELELAFARIERDRYGSFDKGPYFFGDEFSLVDLTFHTLFGLIGGMGRHFDVSVQLPDWALAWGDAINARPSVIRATALLEAFGRHGTETPLRVEANTGGEIANVATG
ncbi:glutathione S-transferase family protein [Maricaulaceae bacterium NA33B04]|nr:glutathione S-transferase family protein [Maricaulaceae bacterium NA33B04]